MEHVFIGNVDIIKTDDVSCKTYKKLVKHSVTQQAPPTIERLRKAGCRFWLMSEKDEKSVIEIARYSGFLVTKLKIKKVVVEKNREVFTVGPMY